MPTRWVPAERGGYHWTGNENTMQVFWGNSIIWCSPSTPPSPPPNTHTGCVANLTILADTHERRERHAHRGVRHDSVPALHVEPIRARLRQLRVVVQELEQDDNEVVAPRPDPRHYGHEQNKSANLGKRDD